MKVNMVFKKKQSGALLKTERAMMLAMGGKLKIRKNTNELMEMDSSVTVERMVLKAAIFGYPIACLKCEILFENFSL